MKKSKDYEETFLIIKPEAMEYKDEILLEIKKHKFEIVASTETILDESEIGDLYRVNSSEVLMAHKEYLKNKKVYLGVISSKNAVNKFLLLCGLNPDPTLCGKETIRCRYGLPPIIVNKILYYRNAIHRPMTKEEASSNLSLYKNKIIQRHRVL